MSKKIVVEVTVRTRQDGGSKTIPYIKFIRMATGVGLKEAKDVVDDMVNKEAEEQTFQFTLVQFGRLMANLLDPARLHHDIATLDRNSWPSYTEFLITEVQYLDEGSHIIDLTNK
jgi:hypothetical protein